MKSRSTWTLKEGQTLRIGRETLKIISSGPREVVTGEVSTPYEDTQPPNQAQRRKVLLGGSYEVIGGAQVTASPTRRGRAEVRITIEQILEVHPV